MYEPEGMLMSRRLMAVIGLCALAACAGPPPGEKLSAAQLGREVPGHSAIGRGDAIGDFAVYNEPNGSFRFKDEDVSDVGSYRITPDGQLCMKFDKAFNGNEYCYAVYKEGDTFRSVLNGQVTTTYTMAPGNPRNL